MNTRKKIVLGVVGGAVAIAGPLGVVSSANAAGETSTATVSTSPWQGGHGPGMGGWSGHGAANGAGYGMSAVADYLAEKLGVSADDVAAALQQYHVDNPMTEPGRDLSEADVATRQQAEADALASALKVDAAKVLAALQSFQDDRQAAMTTQLRERLDAMVTAGTMTQAQADAILAAHEDGEPMMLGGHGGPMMLGGHGGGRWG